MKQFTILNLLFLVTLIGTVLALVSARQVKKAVEAKLIESNEKLEEYREELGRLKVIDPAKYQIRSFRQHFRRTTFGSDEYPVEQERFRLYAPDASKVEFLYKSGKLPLDGLPDRGFRMPVKLDQDAAEISIVFMAVPMDEFGGISDITIHPRYSDGSGNSTGVSSGVGKDAMPWMHGKRCRTIRTRFKKDEPFELTQPELVFKKFHVDKEGNHIGSMIWVRAKSEPPKKKTQASSES